MDWLPQKHDQILTSKASTISCLESGIGRILWQCLNPKIYIRQENIESPIQLPLKFLTFQNSKEDDTKNTGCQNLR